MPTILDNKLTLNFIAGVFGENADGTPSNGIGQLFAEMIGGIENTKDIQTMYNDVIEFVKKGISEDTTVGKNGSQLLALATFNALMFIIFYQIGYFQKEGIVEYALSGKYEVGSIVKGTDGLNVYRSKVASNVGNALTDNTKWELVLDTAKARDLFETININSNTLTVNKNLDLLTNNIINATDIQSNTLTANNSNTTSQGGVVIINKPSPSPSQNYYKLHGFQGIDDTFLSLVDVSNGTDENILNFYTDASNNKSIDCVKHLRAYSTKNTTTPDDNSVITYGLVKSLMNNRGYLHLNRNFQGIIQPNNYISFNAQAYKVGNTFSFINGGTTITTNEYIGRMEMDISIASVINGIADIQLILNGNTIWTNLATSISGGPTLTRFQRLPFAGLPAGSTFSLLLPSSSAQLMVLAQTFITLRVLTL